MKLQSFAALVYLRNINDLPFLILQEQPFITNDLDLKVQTWNCGLSSFKSKQ